MTTDKTAAANIEALVSDLKWSNDQQWKAQRLAEFFHKRYEDLAPSYGYETRAETKQFDARSPNGKLMAAVCFDVLAALARQQAAQACGSYECKAAQRDGVLCADGECDVESGVRQAAPGAYLAWNGFNVHGDEASIAAVKAAVYDASTVPQWKERVLAAESALREQQAAPAEDRVKLGEEVKRLAEAYGDARIMASWARATRQEVNDAADEFHAAIDRLVSSPADVQPVALTDEQLRNIIGPAGNLVVARIVADAAASSSQPLSGDEYQRGFSDGWAAGWDQRRDQSQPVADVQRDALNAIANYPMPEQDDMQAANMRAIALAAMSAASQESGGGK